MHAPTQGLCLHPLAGCRGCCLTWPGPGGLGDPLERQDSVRSSFAARPRQSGKQAGAPDPTRSRGCSRPAEERRARRGKAWGGGAEPTASFEGFLAGERPRGSPAGLLGRGSSGWRGAGGRPARPRGGLAGAGHRPLPTAMQGAAGPPGEGASDSPPRCSAGRARRPAPSPRSPAPPGPGGRASGAGLWPCRGPGTSRSAWGAPPGRPAGPPA